MVLTIMSGETVEFFTPAEVAKILRVSPGTVARWVKLDQIRAVRLPSGHYRIPREEVDRLLREARRDPET
jgi:excisionase family DNA binding protein